MINPLGVPRRVAVILPDAALDLRPEGPLQAAQFTDEGVYAVVDVPAFGFAWVPAEPNLEQPPSAPGGLSARGRTLKNESIEIEIDEATGGHPRRRWRSANPRPGSASSSSWRAWANRATTRSPAR